MSARTAAQNCATNRVSVGTDGEAGAGSSSRASISVDGRFVVFESAAANLVEDDLNGSADIFVRDRWLGTTERVSLSTAGVEGNLGSRRAAISGNGRFVVFESDATNLVTGDTNGETDIFVRDRQTGQTSRVSVDSLGGQANSWSARPAISFDGGFIAFESFATNLVTGDANGGLGDIFVRDRVSGTTALVSVSSSGVQANFTSQTAAISGTGRFVAFESFATNLVSGLPAVLGNKYIYVRDRDAGITQLVSVGAAGVAPNGSSESPSISDDGRYVAFQSRATNLGSTDENDAWDVYLRDRGNALTTRLSLNSHDGEGDADSTLPSISPDGTFVVFTSLASQLVTGTDTVHADVYLRNRTTGDTTRVSVNDAEDAADGQCGLAHGAAITVGARQIVFHSSAMNLVEGDDGLYTDVFVRECATSEFQSFCFGTASACPCGIAGGPVAGCQNSFSTGGAVLSASGVSSLNTDSVTLSVSGAPPLGRVLFFQGDAQVAGGLGEFQGDGLTCVTGALVRLGLKTASGGSASVGHLVPGDGSLAVHGAIPSGGATRYYQVLYRDNGPFCTASNINLSNGLAITWEP